MSDKRLHSKSATTSILKAFIPYSRESFELAFHPNRFFNELERSSGYQRRTLQSAMNRAQKLGYLERSGKILRLTEKGKKELEPFTAKRLDKHARLMIIFDVPERESYLRRQLRLIIRQWQFVQVQKSVWVSRYDHKKSLVKLVKELEMEDYVEVYECARLFPRR